MRKLIALSLMTTSIFCAAAFANPIREIPPTKILNIFHVNERTLQEFTHGQHPEYVIEFPEQTLVPINFLIKGDVVELINHPGNFLQIKVKRKFYTRVRDGKVLFSADLNDWKDFSSFFNEVTALNIELQDGLPVIDFKIDTSLKAK